MESTPHSWKHQSLKTLSMLPASRISRSTNASTRVSTRGLVIVTGQNVITANKQSLQVSGAAHVVDSQNRTRDPCLATDLFGYDGFQIGLQNTWNHLVYDWLHP